MTIEELLSRAENGDPDNPLLKRIHGLVQDPGRSIKDTVASNFIGHIARTRAQIQAFARSGGAQEGTAHSDNFYKNGALSEILMSNLAFEGAKFLNSI